MSQKLANLLECPRHKLEDRKAILERVYVALVTDPDAVIVFKGETHRWTPEESANWQSRQVVADLLLTFPTNVSPNFGVVRTVPEEPESAVAVET